MSSHVVVQGTELWCKACGQRQPLQLPLAVKDFSHFCQTWAQAHTDCALAERSKLVEELREVANKLMDEKVALRKAIAAWKPYWHGANCNIFDYGSYAEVRCNCGADEKNVDREKARKLAGLEDK